MSVVIVSWNTRDDLLRCLASLERASTRVPSTVTVVDNASTDGTTEAVSGSFPNVTVIANARNRGFAAACNQGITTTAGRYILILNADTRLAADTIETLVALLEKEPAIGIAGCRLLNDDGSQQRSIHRFPTFASQVLIALKLHRLFRHTSPIARYYGDDVDYHRLQEVDQVKGACFFVRRSMLDAIGLFDERFWIWFEEVDLCLRARKAGWKVVYTPEATVWHAGARSFRRNAPHRNEWLYLRSLIAFFRKHRPWYETLGLLVLVPLAEGLAVLQTIIGYRSP